jgi:hypothetical protein
LRKPDNLNELELLLAVTMNHVVYYLDQHPVMRFFARLGLFNKFIYDKSMALAYEELTTVDFDGGKWQFKYGAKMKNKEKR